MMTPCDSLVAVPREDWPYLAERCKEKWPFGLTAFNMLKTQCITLERFPDYPVKIFSPFGDPDNGIICILSLTPTAYEISIFCFTNNSSKLTEALANTKYIDWRKKVIFCDIMQEHVKYIQDAFTCLEKNPYSFHTEIFHLSKEKAMLFDKELPENVTLQILPPEMAEELNDAWPHKYPGSLEYFRGMLARKSVTGVVSGDVRAWGVISCRGSIHGVATKPEYRRRGYAQLIIKALSKKLAEEGREVYACIIKTNESSIKLFDNLGFKSLYPVTSIISE